MGGPRRAGRVAPGKACGRARRVAFLATLVLGTGALHGGASPAGAADAPATRGRPSAGQQPPALPGADLDTLFARLKQAPDEQAAALTSRIIEQRWARSGSATTDLLVQRADQALSSGERNLALEILDRVIALQPDWAQGWNKRATVFFVEEDFSRSLADIQQVLAREPRHFGALAGMASILERIGDDKDALRVYERLLDIYPLMPGPKKAAERLRSKITSFPI